MVETGFAAMLFLAAAAALGVGLRYSLRDRALRRLEAVLAPPPRVTARRHPLVRRHRLAALLLGAAAGAAAARAAPVPPVYALPAGFVAAILGLLIEDLGAQRRLFRLQQQLADAVDLLMGSLQAGAGIGTALASTAAVTPRPLRSLLEEMSRRMRLGEPSAAIFREPTSRVSLPSFRLFALCLGAQWEAGGSLATSLAAVGRSLRDRIAVERRVRSQAGAVVASALGVAAITYGIGVAVALWDPERAMGFFASHVGVRITVFALILQGVGLLWMWQLARIRI